MKQNTWALRAMAIAVLYPVASHATVDIALKLDANFATNSNLFRVDRTMADNAGPSPIAPLLETGMQSQTVDLGVGIPLGSERTRLILTTSLARQTYSARPDLDHDPQTLTATLPWRWTDILEGELSAGKTRTAYAFDDFYPLLDITERTWTQATLRLVASPTLSFPVFFSRQSLRHRDVATHVFLDSDSQRTGASVLYRSAIGSTLQGGLARTETQYPGRTSINAGSVPTETDTDVFVEMNWAYSPITQFSARWANRQRSFSSNAFSTRTNLYRMGVSHAYSQQLQLDAQLWQLPASSTQQGILDGTSTGKRIGLRYAPNSKWEVSVSWQKQSERNPVESIGSTVTPLNPDTSNLTIRGRYNIDTKLSAYLDIGTEKRVRRQTDSAHQQVLRLGIEYRFENIPGAAARTPAAALPAF